MVLGAGGSVGLAFHGGVLAALEEATGWDPRTAEVIVGTSAGSLTASLLRVGLPAADLRRVTENEPLSPEGALLAEVGAPHRPRVRASAFLRPRLPAAPGAAARALLTPWRCNPASLAAALLPSGPVSTDAISRGLDEVTGGRWPDGQLWVCTHRLGDGRRVVFGRPGAPEARVGQAVAASCAIPGYFTPVRIASGRYVDGGVTSMHNVDLLADLDLDLVIVSAPMACASHRAALSPDHALRAPVRRQLDREIARVRRQGTPVITFAPTRRVVAAMGPDAMDARRRHLVSRAARLSTLAHLERSGIAAYLADGASGVAPQSPAA
jgi:NTE family protein